MENLRNKASTTRGCNKSASKTVRFVLTLWIGVYVNSVNDVTISLQARPLASWTWSCETRVQAITCILRSSLFCVELAKFCWYCYKSQDFVFDSSSWCHTFFKISLENLVCIKTAPRNHFVVWYTEFVRRGYSFISTVLSCSVPLLEKERTCYLIFWNNGSSL